MVHSGLTRLGNKVTTALPIILKHVSVFCFGENISKVFGFFMVTTPALTTLKEPVRGKRLFILVVITLIRPVSHMVSNNRSKS